MYYIFMPFVRLFTSSGSTLRGQWEAFLNSREAIVLLFPIITALIAFGFITYYIVKMLRHRRAEQEAGVQAEDIFDNFNKPHGKLTRKDIAPMLIIVLIYACFAFFRLGNNFGPETNWVAVRNTPDAVVTIDLGEEVNISRIIHFNGVMHGNVYGSRVHIYTSDDGERWVNQTYLDSQGNWRNHLHVGFGDVLYWRSLNFMAGLETRFIRFEAQQTFEIFEMGIEINTIVQNEYGEWVPGVAPLSPEGFVFFCENGPRLFDEQQYVPFGQSRVDTFMNSAYFDEIFHARTAYEIIHGIYPFEVTHPPLGKAFISVGIRMFGFNPFGWRFIGTLFGVLMLPFLYWLIKSMFNKTFIAIAGTTLFAVEFMLIAQTRIATIDTYSTIFIIISYLFMYRYITSGLEAKFSKMVLPLFLSGLAFGLGAASKWTVIYAGIGLFFFYFLYNCARFRLAIDDEKLDKWGHFFGKKFAFHPVIVPLVLVWIAGMFRALAILPQTPWNIIWTSTFALITAYFLTRQICCADKTNIKVWLQYAWKTVAVSLVFFIVIPIGIYVASYRPYVATEFYRRFDPDSGAQRGYRLSVVYQVDEDGNYIYDEDGERLQAPGQRQPMTMNIRNHFTVAWHNSRNMLHFHSGIRGPGHPEYVAHPFASMWYQWIFNHRPMLFYQNNHEHWVADGSETGGHWDGTRTSIASFNNPLISWAGFLAIFAVGVAFVRKRTIASLFILVGYLSQMLPWIFVSRETYAYHYFAAIVFLILALAYLFNDLVEFEAFKKKAINEPIGEGADCIIAAQDAERTDSIPKTSWQMLGNACMSLFARMTATKWVIVAFVAVAGLLFLMFLPVLIGLTVPRWYPMHLLRWFPHHQWPF